MMRLIPRETKFFRMFAEVSENVTEGARLLQDILKNPANIAERLAKLQAIEHRGDEMTHNIITTLNQTFITPFDREDIHRLTSSLDDVLDFVNSAGMRLTLYRISSPPPVAAELAGLIVEQSEELAKGVSLLEQNQRAQIWGLDISEEMLRFDLKNENETIRNYRERVRQCEALGEYALAEHLRDILVQEQEHQTDLATALGEDVPDVTKPDERA